MPGVAGAAAVVAADVAAAVEELVVEEVAGAVVVVVRDHRWGTSVAVAAGRRVAAAPGRRVAVADGRRWVADSAHNRPRGQTDKGPQWVTLRDPTLRDLMWPLARPAVAASVRLAGGQTPEVQDPGRPAAWRIDLRCGLPVT